eukprot:6179271-Pleurochrysis_carterae.AAC.8
MAVAVKAEVVKEPAVDFAASSNTNKHRFVSAKRRAEPSAHATMHARPHAFRVERLPLESRHMSD